MNLSAAAHDVFTSFRTAWRYRWPFLVAHLLVRLLVLAVIAPVSSLILSLAIATSGQSALTDQDIALFLVTPAGIGAALVITCLLLVGAILDVSIMTGVLRSGTGTARKLVASGLGLVLARLPAVFGFCLRLVFQVLLVAVPFTAVAASVALISLRSHDINYYLTHWPPVFVMAAGVIVAILLAFVVTLAWRLSSWAIALHLVLFSDYTPAEAFRESARVLRGHKKGLVVAILFWGLALWVLAFVLTVIAGVLLNVIPPVFSANLRTAATATIAILLLLAIANAIVAAVSNGALADLLNRLFVRTAPMQSQSPTAGTRTVNARESAAFPTAMLVGAAVIAAAGGLVAGGVILERIGSDRTVEIIAHRGASGSRPENTLAAIDKAVEDHADWVEIDVQETADGEVVVAHDSDFMKLAGVDLKIWDATTEDLVKIDIGSWFDPVYSGERTPTLRQALEMVKGRGKVLIELKYYGHDVDLEARVARVVDDVGMAGDIAVMSLKYDGVRKMQALRPEWRYGVLAAKAIGDLAGLEANFLAVNAGQASLQLIRTAHSNGKQVYVWTVDDPLAMSRMISMGVDGLITNEPELARQVIEARNNLTTYERLALWVTDRFRIGSFNLVAEESDA